MDITYLIKQLQIIYFRFCRSDTHLSIDQRLHDDHLRRPMHLLDLTGQRMAEIRIEPHQLALGPLHV